MNSENTRRAFLYASAAIGTGFVLSACNGENNMQAGKQAEASGAKKEEHEKGGEVTATEDLMREHGVLRRALLVYTAASKLRTNPASVSQEALQKTARLFRAFGEDYHEKKLEETYIFPAIKKAGGPAASYPDILITQHNRGREITDYILSVTQGAKLGTNAEPLARALESLALMYQHHAAREDTIVFPAWKKTLPEKELHELAEKFQEIEHQQFGEDGFDEAVKQISEIEGMLGLADIAQFTAPLPPQA